MRLVYENSFHFPSFTIPRMYCIRNCIMTSQPFGKSAIKLKESSDVLHGYTCAST